MQVHGVDLPMTIWEKSGCEHKHFVNIGRYITAQGPPTKLPCNLLTESDTRHKGRLSVLGRQDVPF